jgi:hypothetical protein
MDWIANLQFLVTLGLLFFAARLLLGITRKPPSRKH